MTDDIFGGSTPKANVVWVPTALPALATTLLELSMVLIPIRKLFTLLRGTCLASPLANCSNSMTEPSPQGRRRVRLKVVNPRSAGIDIGSRFHVVAIPVELDDEPVRKFSSFTSDLKSIAQWLLAIGVTTVAMESTGIYWVPLYEILVGHGIEVFLVNARHAKNVPGRKTDISDAQWLQQLHSYGLVRASFQPDPCIARLRAYFRQRDTLVRYRSSHQQHIQKALMQMNLQLHHVVRDITGLTARRIIDAILAGERDPLKLATLRDRRCKEIEETIAAALDGNYQEEHLFELKVAVEMFDVYSLKIQECELAGQSVLQELAGDEYAEPEKQASDWRIRSNGFSFNPQALITSVAGRDLLSLPGLGPATVLTLISECGLDMTRWPSAKHFVSWLGLSPQNKISGGRVLSSRTRQGTTRAGSAFWMAAVPISRTNTALGGISAAVICTHWQKQSIDCNSAQDSRSLLQDNQIRYGIPRAGRLGIPAGIPGASNAWAGATCQSAWLPAGRNRMSGQRSLMAVGVS